MTPSIFPPINDTLYVWLAIIALGLCTAATRASFMLLGDRLPLPDAVRRALRYAPAAALVAIIVPELLPWSPVTGPMFDIKVIAAAVGVVAMVMTRSTVTMIVAGMLALWALRAMLG